MGQARLDRANVFLGFICANDVRQCCLGPIERLIKMVANDIVKPTIG